jgi:hypothetical protein
MKSFDLVGVNQLGVAQEKGKDVISFTDRDGNFSISVLDSSYIQLSTKKGCYNLSKHPTINYFSGTLNGHKVQVHLKPVSGWIKYW